MHEPQAEDDEPAVLERAKAGDRAAQDELCRRYMAPLHAWVRFHWRSAVGKREDVSDIVQTVFRSALEDLPRFEHRGRNSLRNWIFTYADRKLGNRARFYRAERRNADREADVAMSQLFATVCTPSQVCDAREEAARFERAFAQLSPDDQQIILLARVEELPHAVIAHRLGISEDASKQSLSRAKKRLALAMAL